MSSIKSYKEYTPRSIGYYKIHGHFLVLTLIFTGLSFGN